MNLTKLAEHKLFSATTMTDALRYFDYQPSLLGALDIFQTVASSTIDVAIEREQNIIKIVPCTPRGGPATTPNRGVRDIRFVSTPRIAIESTLLRGFFPRCTQVGGMERS
ncbi:major capsid protein [Bartonella sp. DGB2]|uniref:major capsid protein n=1 Tax=Bartonella sp. DGB2 TaxID=3388426 RepID=UPI003990083F